MVEQHKRLLLDLAERCVLTLGPGIREVLSETAHFAKDNGTVQELAISNMLEIAALRELLFQKGIITKEELIAEFKKLDREMKEKGAK